MQYVIRNNPEKQGQPWRKLAALIWLTHRYVLLSWVKLDHCFSSLKKHCDYTASVHRMKCTIPLSSGKYLFHCRIIPLKGEKRYELLLSEISWPSIKVCYQGKTVFSKYSKSSSEKSKNNVGSSGSMANSQAACPGTSHTSLGWAWNSVFQKHLYYYQSKGLNPLSKVRRQIVGFFFFFCFPVRQTWLTPACQWLLNINTVVETGP